MIKLLLLMLCPDIDLGFCDLIQTDTNVKEEILPPTSELWCGGRVPRSYTGCVQDFWSLSSMGELM
jgi:hypothetical protein